MSVIGSTTEFTVNLFTASDQLHPRIARFTNGNIIHVFQTKRADNIYFDVDARILDAPYLSQILTETQLNTFQQTGVQASATEPIVAALTGGGGVVVWTDDRQDGDADGIYARLISGTGTLGGVEFRINSTLASFQNQPTIAALSSGGFVVAWTDASQTPGDTSSQAIRARLFDASGNPVAYNGSSNDFVVNTTTTFNQQQPAVAALAGGGFVVTWTDTSNAIGQNVDVRGRVFNAAGPVGGDFVIPTQLSNVQTNSHVAALSSGGFVVAWTDGLGDALGQNPLRGRIFDAGGTAIGSDFVVNATGQQNNNFEVSIASLPDSRFVAAWTDNSQTLGDASGKAVHARIFLNDGTPIGSEFLLNKASVTGDQFAPSLQSVGTAIYASWTDGAVDGSGSGIRTAVFNAAAYQAGDGGESWLGFSVADTITGGAGNDTIDGRAGADSINGGGGNDFIIGGDGGDAMNGGPGFDSVSWYGAGGPALVNLTNQALNAFAAQGDTVAAFEAYYLTDSGDVFVNDANGGYVYGFAGADSITGGAGVDFIEGGTGADTIDGGPGFDYVSYANAAAGVRLDFTNPATNTGEAVGDAIANVEAFYLSANTDVFIGQTGQNFVFAGAGNDELFGGVNANDWLFGEADNDFISGGNFDDLMSGGSGADRYAFTSWVGNGFDSILDFTPGQDKIQLTGAGFGLAPGGLTAGVNFVSGAAPVATGAVPTVFYNTTFGIILFDADGVGGAFGQVQLAQIMGAPALTAADFIVA
jgi:hypothetical protein